MEKNQSFFDSLGLDMDGKNNGRLMPGSEAKRHQLGEVLYHRGSHPDYSDFVDGKVKQIRDKWKPGINDNATIKRIERLQRKLNAKIRDGSVDIPRSKLKCNKIGAYKTRKIMTQLHLQVKQRIAYKVTNKRKYTDSVAVNLLNQNFNPVEANHVWSGDITYLKTGEGWMYLAVVMDLYSRRINGWEINKRMTTNLIISTMQKAYNLRKPTKGLIFHSDRGAQYTSKRFRELLNRLNIRASMGDVGACWDNAVVERFFGSLKHDWILKVAQPTREGMIKDVKKYMRYYNLERLHTTNGDLAPIEYEYSLRNVSV